MKGAIGFCVMLWMVNMIFNHEAEINSIVQALNLFVQACVW